MTARHGWYRISNYNGAAQVSIYDEIGGWGVSAQDFLRELGDVSGPVEVHLNSPGGDVFEAFAIYNALASRPDVTTVVDALAASAASVILMAGERRLMARTSQMMIHEGYSHVSGDAADMQHMLGRLETVSGQIAEVYALTCGGDAAQWRDLMRSETWFTPAQAQEAGLITGIIDIGRTVEPTAVGGRALPGVIRNADNAGWVQRDGEWEYDPDGDGDDDSSPETDTDHSHWSADGTQLKSIPPNPATGRGGKPMPSRNQSGSDVQAAVDNSPWDASKAWSNGANSDDPAAFYAGICAGRKAGDKNTQAAWALPYKYHPGDPPNAAGTRNALARLPQTQGLTNEAEARRKLEAAMKQINPDYQPGGNQTDPNLSGKERSTIMSTLPQGEGTLTIEARRSRCGEITGQLEEIAGQYAAAVLPAEVQAEWDQLVAERRDHQAALEAADARSAVLAEIYADDPNKHDRPQNRAQPPSRWQPPSPAVHTSRDIYDLGAIRQQARSFDELPGLYRDNAMRVVEASRFPGANRETAQGTVASLLDSVDDEQGSLARRVIATGNPLYTRAFFKAVRQGGYEGLSAEETKVIRNALTVGGTTSAGLAVPFQLDPSVILTSDGVTNPVRAISRVERITVKTWEGVTSQGVTVSRATEAQATTDNAPTLAQPAVTPSRVQAFIPFSIEADMDWAQLQAEMTRLLTDGKDVEEAASFVNGNGTAPNPQGVLAGLPAGSQVVGNTITMAGLYGAVDALPERWQSRATILASRTIYNVVRQMDTVGTLYAPLTQGIQPTLFGYPARICSTMASNATPAVGDRYLLIGDFSQYLIVDRVGMDVELVPHLFGPAQTPTGQRGIYAIWRNSATILVPTAFRYVTRTV